MKIPNNYAPMIYRDGELTKKDLKAGHLYATNDNRIVMFMGIDNHNDYVFYKVCGYLFDNPNGFVYNGDERYLCHHSIQVSSIVQMVDEIMNQPVDENCLVHYRNVPRIVSNFAYTNKENEIEEWYTKDKKESSPDISFTNVKKTSEYVNAKDLEPGKLYYTGQLWRSLYCYLGRDSNNRFCWSFIGNEYLLKHNETEELISGFEKTKANKKVHPIEHAPNDPHAFIYGGIEEFLDGSFCADVSKIDLDRGRAIEYPSSDNEYCQEI